MSGPKSATRSEEHTSELQSLRHIVCRLLLDKKKKFKVTTSDQTTHNIHPLPPAGTGNIGWNKSQPPGAPPIESSCKNQEFFFLNNTATPEIYPLSLHDAPPI